MLTAMTRSYFGAKALGYNFKMVAIPDDVDVGKDPLAFDPKQMRAVLQLGHPLTVLGGGLSGEQGGRSSHLRSIVRSRRVPRCPATPGRRPVTGRWENCHCRCHCRCRCGCVCRC